MHKGRGNENNDLKLDLGNINNNFVFVCILFTLIANVFLMLNHKKTKQKKIEIIAVWCKFKANCGTIKIYH